MEYCEINLALARDPIVCRRAALSHRADDSQHPFGNQAADANDEFPNDELYRTLSEIRASSLLVGPRFCAPALRLVCPFEDDDAAGP